MNSERGLGDPCHEERTAPGKTHSNDRGSKLSGKAKKRGEKGGIVLDSEVGGGGKKQYLSQRERVGPKEGHNAKASSTAVEICAPQREKKGFRTAGV